MRTEPTKLHISEDAYELLQPGQDDESFVPVFGKRCGARPWQYTVSERFCRDWLAAGKTELLFCRVCLTPVVQRRLDELHATIARKEKELDILASDFLEERTTHAN